MSKKLAPGFTLMELLVVLAVIGIMSAFVVPRMTGSLGVLNQKTAARKICSLLRYARSQAVSKGVVLIVTIDFEKGTLAVYDEKEKKTESSTHSTSSDGTRSENRLLYLLPEGVYFEAFEDPPNGGKDRILRIVFYPVGRASGAKFKVVCDGKPGYTFMIDRVSGSVSVNK